MNKVDAEELLPKFKILEGIRSNQNESQIDCVFIGYKDIRLTAEKYYATVIHRMGFPEHQSDQGNYTLVAHLENGKFIGVKRIVIEENITSLLEDAKKLDDIEDILNNPAEEQGAISKT